jgi:hypothetical protein
LPGWSIDGAGWRIARREQGCEILHIEWFQEKSVEAGHHLAGRAACAHQQQEGLRGAEAAEFAGQPGAGEARHLRVDEQDIGRGVRVEKLVDRGLAGFGALHCVAFGVEKDSEQVQAHGVVVNDQHSHRLGFRYHDCRVEYQA